MTDRIFEKAYAKLNISLDVSGRREDGFHDMAMIMQTVSLFDGVTVELQPSGHVTAVTNLPFIPSDERNLAVKAAKRFLAAAGLEDRGIKITIDKKIPVGAGMAGGSADAAAVLRALNRMFGRPLDKEQLLEISAQTGSDVPFCLIGGTAFAEGRGEILRPLRDLPECVMLICKPKFSISTPELFRELDKTKLRTHPDNAGLKAAIEEGDLLQISHRMYNVFETVKDRRMRSVSAIKSELQSAGALGTVMTGTGSAVFGVFKKGSGLSALAAKLKKEHGFSCEAEPVGRLL